MGAPYAGLVSRAGALAVDVAVVTVSALAVGGLPPLVWDEMLRTPVPGWLTTGVRVAATILPWLYFTVFWWLAGQTVGGRLIGVVVRRRDGRPVGLLRAALRSAIGLALAPLWFVGLVWILVDHRRRAWHDLLFGTTVRYSGATAPAAGRRGAD